MATFNLDSVATTIKRAKPWVAGVFGQVARYNRSTTTLARSQQRFATRPLLTSSVDTPADTPIEGRLTPFDLTRSIQFDSDGMIAPWPKAPLGHCPAECRWRARRSR